jgi:hypothetical protein
MFVNHALLQKVERCQTKTANCKSRTRIEPSCISFGEGAVEDLFSSYVKRIELSILYRARVH